MSTYEGMYIFPEALKDESLEAAIDRAKEEVEKLDGQVVSVTRLGRRTFARPMQKQSAGQYVVMVLNLEGTRIKALHERYRLSEDVFRVQFTRQDKPVPAAPAVEPKKEEADDAVA